MRENVNIWQLPAEVRAWVEERNSVNLDPGTDLPTVRMTQHLVMVVIVPPDAQTEGGIYIPDNAQRDTGLCYPIKIGPDVGLGDGRYEPMWQVETLEEHHAHQREMLGACYLCAVHSFRELRLDQARDRGQIGYIHVRDIHLEIGAYSYPGPRVPAGGQQQ